MLTPRRAHAEYHTRWREGVGGTQPEGCGRAGPAFAALSAADLLA